MTQAAAHADRREWRYPLAFLGAHLSFIPLFALLLPRRVAAVAPDQAIFLLSILLLAGGVAASVAHIVAGRFSDRWLVRHANRRGVIAIGLAALIAAQLGIAFATGPAALMAAIVALQIALNLMFAPLGALLADHVADARKGRVAGLLNATLPLASLGTALAAWLFPIDGPGGFLLVAAIAALAVLPLLIGWPFGAVATRESAVRTEESAAPTADYIRMWCARLLVQLGAAFVINYFFLYLVQREPLRDASRMAGKLAIAATILSFASAIAAGYWTDRSGRRRPPMIAAALACATGLTGIATSSAWPVVTGGFILFHVGLTAFLAVDSAMVTQLLAGHARRGELLGVMNLTNTLPAIVVPALTLASVRANAIPDWPLAFGVAAALALLAAFLLTRIRSIR